MKKILFVLPAFLILIWAILFNNVGTEWVPLAVAALLITPLLWWAAPPQVLQLPLIFTMAVAILYGPAASVAASACYAVVAVVVQSLRWMGLVLAGVVAIYDALLYSLVYRWVGWWNGVLLMALVSFFVFLASLPRETFKYIRSIRMLCSMAVVYFMSAITADFAARQYPRGYHLALLPVVGFIAFMWFHLMRPRNIAITLPSAPPETSGPSAR